MRKSAMFFLVLILFWTCYAPPAFRIDVSLPAAGLEAAGEQKQPQKVNLPPHSFPAPVPALTLPDLVIINEDMEQHETQVTASAKLRNSGMTGASFQTGQVMAELAALGGTYKIKAPGGGMYIAPDAMIDLSALLTGPVPGTHTVTWRANPDHIVAERNYSNNEKVCQWVIVNPLPDLVVSQLKANPLPGFQPGDMIIEFTIMVANQGNAVAPAYIIQRTSIKLDGYPADVSSLVWTYNNLAPGESAVLKTRTQSPLAPKLYQVKAFADSGNELPELREDNNGATLNFTVPDHFIIAVDPNRQGKGRRMLPDLVISQLTVTPLSGTPGTLFEFTIVVTNQGNAVAPKGGSQLCKIRLDGSIADWSVEWGGYRDLAPGESVVHKVRLNSPMAIGSHQLRAIVDDHWDLTEKNEANNEATVGFTVN